jgi:CubicO group peptidase (beta-lactamase class C family)
MTEVRGTVAPGFEDVRGEFAAFLGREVAEYGDPGAQLAAYLDGRQVVDLWSDALPGDDLTGVFSISKGAAHLSVAVLVQDGVLSLDEPAWGLTLREVLGHRAGLVGVDGGFTAAEIADDALIAARLERQKPFWEPGTAYGYHALVVAALTGAVVRRATGRSLQQVYAERIRDPYGLDLHLGLPKALEPRYRPSQPSPMPYPQMDPASLMAAAFTVPHGSLDAFVNDRNVRAHGQASAGGVGNARGVARLYAAAISTVDGRAPLLSAATATEFATPYSLGLDLVTGETDHFGLGFETVPQKYPYLGAGAFGHGGAAGAMGWADAASGVAYGYVRRRFAYPPGGGAVENEALGAAIVRAARA